MKTIHRQDGTVLATVNTDGQKVYLVMRAPDGYNGRQACWLLAVEEVDRLTDALDKAAVELTCQG